MQNPSAPPYGDTGYGNSNIVYPTTFKHEVTHHIKKSKGGFQVYNSKGEAMSMTKMMCLGFTCFVGVLWLIIVLSM